MSVLIETSIGSLVIDLYPDERPNCSKNFLKLCKIKYYNFSLFHSIQRNLSAQTGDPSGTGKGGISIFGKCYGEQANYFEAETKPRIKHRKMGALSMVNNGSNMHGSQFFVTLAPDLDYLDGVHTVFGEVAEDKDNVLEKLNEAYCDEDHRPYRDIRILHTIILDDPFDDPEGLAALIPDRSPEPTKEQLETVRIGIDEELDEHKGKTAEQIQEMNENKEAKANAQILQMIGDIPDADIKPPDNILFVCKLNPITTDEDLEIIFSRFGKIESCEIIRDDKSGESLQYAFIEFEKAEDCESAYFKMDNVLIDDRRIHVDFSQSVSKLRKKDFLDSEGRVKLKIKDTARKDNKYDYVFSDEEKDDSKSKKQRKRSRSRSRSHERNRKERYYRDTRRDRRDRYDRNDHHHHHHRDRNHRRSRSRDRNDRRDKRDKYDSHNRYETYRERRNDRKTERRR
ncbi:DgyrCDS7168 [Dimorphilus gyrociliatus]|uniref:Peptidyl-prolyl cis-trans isomerase n=1 Tax=Dimorphilus gyrociliatus TaxID=2664684 RepID=A0A7I8VQA5_9ANNE|nr:DgyrCDS7168 [Dimorphilus gyrociliatus]